MKVEATFNVTIKDTSFVLTLEELLALKNEIDDVVGSINVKLPTFQFTPTVFSPR